MGLARDGVSHGDAETRRGEGSDFSFQGSGEALCAEDGGLMAEEEEKAERGRRKSENGKRKADGRAEREKGMEMGLMWG